VRGDRKRRFNSEVQQRHGDPLCREIVDRFVETKKWRSQSTAKSETGAAKFCESGLLDSLSCFIGPSGLANTLRLGRKNLFRCFDVLDNGSHGRLQHREKGVGLLNR
jgi:hypothetical protein